MRIDIDESVPESCEPMNKHTKRRKRRRAKAKLTQGKSAVRRHARKAGRTGNIWATRTLGRGSRFCIRHPNPEGPSGHNLGVQN